MRVLVVDDDEDQLIVRCMLIAHHGFETIRAGDACSAARLAISKSAHVAVVDLHLPTREIGLRLLGELKVSNPSIHIIVMTGIDPANLQHYPEMRFANEVIVKASPAKALLSSLKRLSERRVA